MKIFLLVLILIALLPTKAYAVTVTINNPPTTVTESEFILNVTVSGASEGNNYLRVDLYKDGTTNYFGETYSGSEWYSGSDYTKYFPITIISGSDWTGDVKARVGNPSTSDYDGQGSYKIRIRRYTNAGTQNADEANRSAVPITISVPTLTPTPTNTPTPNPTSTPTSTSTPTPTNTPTPKPTNTPTPAKKLTPTVVPTSVKISTMPQVMAANTVSDQKSQVQNTSDFDLGGKLDDLDVREQGYNWWKLLIIMGTVIITGAVGVFLYNNHIKERSEEIGNE